MTSPPIAFLCHASEDKPIVRELALFLRANGVEVFLDEWEIRSGESIRRKLESGLEGCTHFIAVVSSASLDKPWVKMELDAGLGRLITGDAKLIPLRLGIDVSALSPFLRTLHSPALNSVKKDGEALLNDIHGVALKPPLGLAPMFVRQRNVDVGLSPAAQSIARLMIELSDKGRRLDPQLAPNDIVQRSHLSLDEIVDGADELLSLGLVSIRYGLGEEVFVVVGPEERLFLMLDGIFADNDPEADARRIAAHMVNEKLAGISTSELAASYGWTPRRMNPAASYLVFHDITDGSQEINPDFRYTFLMTKPSTRRFVRQANG